MEIQKVKIKTWAKMEEEYGLDICDDIDCPLTFTSSMEESMPDDRIIPTRKSGNIRFWIPSDLDDHEWQISDGMIEEVISEVLSE